MIYFNARATTPGKLKKGGNKKTMKTYCVINRKGGIGKTTTAYNLGAALMREGYKVLYVDADSQCNLTKYAGKKPGTGLYEVIAGDADIKDCILAGKNGEGILAGSERLATVEMLKPAPDLLRDCLQKISKFFDFCIIDSPGQLGKITMLIMSAADALIIPVGTGSEDELQGLGLLLQPYYKIQERHADLKIAGVLVSDFDTRSKSLSRDLETNTRNLCNALSINCFDTVIRHRAALPKARLLKQSIFEYDKADFAAEDFANLAAELLGQ